MRSEKFLYREIYQALKKQIEAGELTQGERLPSEDELSETFSVSKITIKRAMDMLKEEGLIRRVQGKGTFVARPDAAEPRPAAAPGRQKLIGLVLEHVATPFGLDMMYQISRRLDERGYKLCIRFTYGSAEKEAEEISSLLALGICGLIIMPCHDSYYSLSIMKLILESFPVVLVDKRMDGLPVNTVCTDGREAIRLLIHHLKERGCRNVAALTIEPSSATSLGDRMDGFRRGVEETGMTCAGEFILPRRTAPIQPFDSDPVRSAEPEYQSAVGEVLDRLDSLPESFVCTEFAIARSLYAAARARGLEVGRDFRACCIDEDYLAMGGFRFTHMRQDEIAVADKAVEVLLGLLDGSYAGRNDFRVPALFRMGATT
ncbi:MAG: GntR family transcriptional regulator [Candidatus Faecivicinus sp.]